MNNMNNMNNMNTNLKYTLVFGLMLMGFGCATITNDPYVPVALSFSDGSNGTCKLTNKRMAIQASIPSSPMIRRSDDALKFDCVSNSGKKGYGSIPSGMEGGKVAASVFFFDLGITDAITDKSRIYPPSFVIPVN